MKRLFTSLAIVLLFFGLSFTCTRPVDVRANGVPNIGLQEVVVAAVDCRNARANTTSIVMSRNATLVHFPSNINMSDSNVVNVTMLGLSFSTGQSLLMYLFNNTDTVTARSKADAMNSTVGTAFQTSFLWHSTGASGTQTNVTYVGPGKANISKYTEQLMPDCLISGIGGFAATFPHMTKKTTASIGVSAIKNSGGLNWLYSMTAMYQTSIAPGSGNHIIYLLDLLNVSSLAPSQYSRPDEPNETPTVSLFITSDQTLTYVSCQPGEANPPTQRLGSQPHTFQFLDGNVYLWKRFLPSNPIDANLQRHRRPRT